MATEDGTPELDIDEQVEQMPQAQKDYWLAVYCALSSSKRFREFVKNNYDIGQKFDHEKKTVEIIVVEKPDSIGPSLSKAQIFKIHGLLTSYGVKPGSITDCTLAVLRVLGQAKSDIVEGSPEQLKLVTDDIRNKLD